jgi:hypothetical protein
MEPISARILITVIEPSQEQGVANPPAFHMTREAAKCLLSDLIQCGIKPDEKPKANGELAATERHLEDMRKIAFGILKL